MIVVVAEATGAADELAEYDVPQGVAAPPIGVAPLHLLRLLPAPLLHAIGEAPRVRRAPSAAEEELVLVGAVDTGEEPRLGVVEEGGGEGGGAALPGGGGVDRLEP